ncbi:MAG: 1-acyl-sn-glycerol-3-phosphate acyltransferase [Treponema sp.]|jgi:1-acyl-sn-glycerol-3-phosphate acyltransferase|nr:1-acyl-sn-glycerol-3-phosphate acyltransferase [Treponema sp.]
MTAKIVQKFLCQKFNFAYDKIEVGHSPYIVVANHLTNWDPLLIAMSFKKSMYYLASDYVYRVGFKSKLLRFFFSPIARARSALETTGVLTIFKRLRDKCNICIFAEGNNSFDGETGAIQSSIGRLIKRAGVALVTYRFTGTYFSFPRWSRFVHRGKSEGRLVKIYSPQQLAQMSEEEIYEVIKNDIYVNAYDEQRKNPIAFPGRKLAEYLETALYCCPQCRQFSTMKSSGALFFCTCGFKVRYTEYGFFQHIDKKDPPPFNTILEWSKWQKTEIDKLAEKVVSSGSKLPIFTDSAQKLYATKRASYNTFIARGSLQLYSDRISIVKKNGKTFDFPLDSIADISVILKMALNFSTVDGRIFEIHSFRPTSATKYLQMIKAIKAIKEMENSAKAVDAEAS